MDKPKYSYLLLEEIKKKLAAAFRQALLTDSLTSFKPVPSVADRSVASGASVADLRYDGKHLSTDRRTSSLPGKEQKAKSRDRGEVSV
jgi:hypothetical protein